LKYQAFPAFVKKNHPQKFLILWGGLPYKLGERLNGIQEVVGSIPIVSTKDSLKSLI